MCVSFRLGLEAGMWDLIVLVPEQCLSLKFLCTNPDVVYQNILIKFHSHLFIYLCNNTNESRKSMKLKSLKANKIKAKSLKLSKSYV